MVAQFYIGCSGFRHPSWSRYLYPRGSGTREILHHYGKKFSFVELHSSLFGLPQVETTRYWNNHTPVNFRFSALFPWTITHKNNLVFSQYNLDELYRAFEPMQKKLLCLLIRIPVCLSLEVGLPRLEKLLSSLDLKFSRYAVQLQDVEWYDSSVFDLLEKYNTCLVWNHLDGMPTPEVLTSYDKSFAYIRFSNRRAPQYTENGQFKSLEDLDEMQYWLRVIMQAKDKLSFVTFAAENSYSGYAPSTAERFRSLVFRPVSRRFQNMKIPKSQLKLEQFA